MVERVLRYDKFTGKLRVAPSPNINVYVDGVNGNDNNDGTEAHPFATIQKAIDSIPSNPEGTVTINIVPLGTTQVTDEVIGSGNDTTSPPLNPLSEIPIIGQTVTITAQKEGGTQTVIDDGNGNLIGDGSGTIDYTTGEVSVTWNDPVPDRTDITATYEFRTPYSEEVKIVGKNTQSGFRTFDTFAATEYVRGSNIIIKKKDGTTGDVVISGDSTRDFCVIVSHSQGIEFQGIYFRKAKHSNLAVVNSSYVVASDCIFDKSDRIGVYCSESYLYLKGFTKVLRGNQVGILSADRSHVELRGSWLISRIMYYGILSTRKSNVFLYGNVPNATYRFYMGGGGGYDCYAGDQSYILLYVPSGSKVEFWGHVVASRGSSILIYDPNIIGGGSSFRAYNSSSISIYKRYTTSTETEILSLESYSGSVIEFTPYSGAGSIKLTYITCIGGAFTLESSNFTNLTLSGHINVDYNGRVSFRNWSANNPSTVSVGNYFYCRNSFARFEHLTVSGDFTVTNGGQCMVMNNLTSNRDFTIIDGGCCTVGGNLTLNGENSPLGVSNGGFLRVSGNLSQTYPTPTKKPIIFVEGFLEIFGSATFNAMLRCFDAGLYVGNGLTISGNTLNLYNDARVRINTSLTASNVYVTDSDCAFDTVNFAVSGEMGVYNSDVSIAHTGGSIGCLSVINSDVKITNVSNSDLIISNFLKVENSNIYLEKESGAGRLIVRRTDTGRTALMGRNSSFYGSVGANDLVVDSWIDEAGITLRNCKFMVAKLLIDGTNASAGTTSIGMEVENSELFCDFNANWRIKNCKDAGIIAKQVNLTSAGKILIDNHIISSEELTPDNPPDGERTTFNFTLGQTPVTPYTVKITDSNNNIWTDDGDGNMTSDAGSGTINYSTGEVYLEYNTAPPEGTTWTADYSGGPRGDGIYLDGLGSYYVRSNNYPSPPVIQTCSRGVYMTGRTSLFDYSKIIFRNNTTDIYEVTDQDTFKRE